MVVLYGSFHLSESMHAGKAFVEGCGCWAKATCGGEGEDQGGKRRVLHFSYTLLVVPLF